MPWFAFVRGETVLATVNSATDPDGDQPGGWERVTLTARPADTDTATWEPTVELVDGVPTVRWAQRPFTAAELDDRTRRLLVAAIPVLRQWAAEADAVTITPTNAVQILGLVADRLGVFFARFADLLALELADLAGDD